MQNNSTNIENAIPLAKEILLGGMKIASEIAASYSYCDQQQYGALLSNAVLAISTLVGKTLSDEVKNA